MAQQYYYPYQQGFYTPGFSYPPYYQSQQNTLPQFYGQEQQTTANLPFGYWGNRIAIFIAGIVILFLIYEFGCDLPILNILCPLIGSLINGLGWIISGIKWLIHL